MKCFSALSCAALLFGIASGQSSARREHSQTYTVKGQLVAPNGGPVRFVTLELRPERRGGLGAKVSADVTGHIVVPVIPPGRYQLSIEGGYFKTLSRTLRVTGDVDLGPIYLQANPEMGWSSGSSILIVPEPKFDYGDSGKVELVGFRPTPILRGRIPSLSITKGTRLSVRVSCLEERRGLPPDSQIELANVPLTSGGTFELANPYCAGDTFAYRELHFSLIDEQKSTAALLLPKPSYHGYDQSNFGISIPLKRDRTFGQETIFAPVFMDNRPFHAEVSIHPVERTFIVGQTVLLNATVTNTSEEVLQSYLSVIQVVTGRSLGPTERVSPSPTPAFATY
ncbi:MAG: carboxypeptidase-like regulatory domain-containing protein [Bryobacteraceae bacterium]